EVSVQDWYLAGHSLGGVMASSFAADQTDRVDGLILLASYPSNDLTDAPFSALSIYGSEDEVLSRESYDEAQEKLPDDYTEIVAVIMANSAITAYRKAMVRQPSVPFNSNSRRSRPSQHSSETATSNNAADQTVREICMKGRQI
ncbi:MAG TPA: alpha/beta hydrolase, partial [Trichococcus flocculiformis]|nr:alpha/beta hydrolase [Trichococcus flocculiformis]